MLITRNGKYKLYSNSTKESRGVAIAIAGNIYHEVYECIKDEDENFLFLKVKIKGKKLLLRAIYGPNRNDKEFFKDIRVRLENVEEQIIIGGDFNTVLDNRQGIENLDKVNGGGDTEYRKLAGNKKLATRVEISGSIWG